MKACPKTTEIIRNNIGGGRKKPARGGKGPFSPGDWSLSQL